MGARPKYGNKRVNRYGLWFDSVHESNRYLELMLLQRAGEIRELQTQVPFELIPSQREPDTIGVRGGVKQGRTLEKACTYVADFVYLDKDGGKVVEDAKSPATRTDAYRIKKKLMLWVHGIRIQEV